MLTVDPTFHMNSAAVSIIVPVYKTPSHELRRFLVSALNQTLTGIQFILVDDASPDDCPRMLDDVAASNERVTVFHRRTNGRAGVARSDGLQMARGKYILFADSDDVMRQDMCETLYRLAETHHADIVSCSWSISDQSGQLIGRGYMPDCHFDLARPRDRTKGFRCLNFALWNKIFRRDVIAPLRFEQFEANIGEDTLFNIAAFCRSRRLVTTSYVGYDYSLHNTSATGQLGKGMPYLRTLAASDDRIKETLRSADGSPAARRFANRIALKRFTVGCGWIAEHCHSGERTAMWSFWRDYLRETLLPSLEFPGPLATSYRLAACLKDPGVAYRLTRIALRLSDPLAEQDKIKARLDHRRRYRRSSCEVDSRNTNGT